MMTWQKEEESEQSAVLNCCDQLKFNPMRNLCNNEEDVLWGLRKEDMGNQ